MLRARAQNLWVLLTLMEALEEGRDESGEEDRQPEWFDLLRSLRATVTPRVTERGECDVVGGDAVLRWGCTGCCRRRSCARCRRG